jgi:hypothetical protein
MILSFGLRPLCRSERQRHADPEVLQHLRRQVVRVRVERCGEGVDELRVDLLLAHLGDVFAA